MYQEKMKIDTEYWLSKTSRCELKDCERWGVDINDLYRYLADYLKKEWCFTDGNTVRHIEEQFFIIHVKCRYGRDGYFRCMGITLQIRGLRPHLVCCYDGTVDREFKEGEVTWKYIRHFPCGGKYED